MESLFINTASILSFIGSVIIKREVWIRRNRTALYGSWFAHIGVIFQDKLNNSAFAIASPLIKIRYGVASWYGKAFDIWMRCWPELIWSLPTISDGAKQQVVPMIPGRSLLKHLHFNCHKVKFRSAVQSVPATEPLRRFIIRLIYFRRPVICNAFVGVGCYLTVRKRLLMLYDIANCASANPISRFLLYRALAHSQGKNS